MRRCYAALLLLACLSLLCSCGARPREIVNISFPEGRDYGATVETFYFDGEYKYSFPSDQSYDCTVTYSDGSTENIVDALKAGRAAVTDLDRFDIFYYKDLPDIVDIVVDEHRIPPTADVEIFYTDDFNIYSFPNGDTSSVITVQYEFGVTEGLKEAIAAGRVTAREIEHYLHGYYFKQPRSLEIASISFSEDVDYPSAEEHFWSDGLYEYVFPSIMSWDCTVTYENGARENLIDALGVGRVKISDLDRFDVSYWRVPVEARIVDIRFHGDPKADMTAEAVCVTEDGEFWYYMGAECYDYVVHYATGAVEPLPDALRDGRATPATLMRYEIPYWTVPIGE